MTPVVFHRERPDVGLLLTLGVEGIDRGAVMGAFAQGTEPELTGIAAVERVSEAIADVMTAPRG